MIVLGVESSCDECAIALVEKGKNILSHKIFSQAELHAPYFGVVPEIASRNHLVKILPLLDQALEGNSLSQIDAVAASIGPGLIGSLVVGSLTAQAIAYYLDKPFIPVDHIEAHLYTPHMVHDIVFPYIALVCSGGHTLLYKVDSFFNYTLLGSTIDDAVGEAFDKVAKMLQLGYPGGPIIQKYAESGNEDFWKLPIGVNTVEDKYNFSYSGLKTAVYYRLKELQQPFPIEDICASFQKAAVDSLMKKIENALNDTGTSRLITVGGVAANSRLRNGLDSLTQSGVTVYHTPIELCGDNAAMVAGRAFVDFNSGYQQKSKSCYARKTQITKGKRI